MAILTGDEIVRMRDVGRLTIDPYEESQVNMNSYNLRLDGTLKRYTGVLLDPRIKNPTEEFKIPQEGFVLDPRRAVLGSTVENAGSEEFVCHVDGRSSTGRLFVIVHCTAARGDLGFKYIWTLELVNLGEWPVILLAGMKIAQATFHTTVGERSRQYKGKYHGATGVQESRMHEDYK